MNDYYESFPQSEFFENKLFLTICFKPFTTEDKVTHFFSRGKKQKDIFKEPVNEMNEICDRLNTYLTRILSRCLGFFDDLVVVYSVQISLF
ncbi:hypothetical protein NGUA16_04087 [Salmonella enterica]|nr:hypothetical protein NGUA16_04087 [Salmonella enterica]